MKVLVCGGRDFQDEALLRATLDELHSSYRFKLLITGGARGADALANAWAVHRGIKNIIYVADWVNHGPAAGPIRNKRMLEGSQPDLVVAFPGGAGTTHMIGIAEKAGVDVYRVLE